MMPFPAEPVPDGAVFGPHHFTWGVIFALFVCLIVWDNYRNVEPIVAAAGLTVALFGFLYTWQYHPVLGASLALGGVTLALIGLLRPSLWWTQYPAGPHAAALFFTLVALDDAVSHAFGIWTPFDWLWKAHIYGLLPG